MATDSDTGGQGDCLQTDFDSLFLTDEADKNALVAKQQQLSYIRSDGGSTPHSRGSPARRNQGGSCKQHPGLSLTSLKHSHSMRDQTSHMKEKYQARYQHRRLSIRTPNGSNNNTPKASGSRNNSLTVNDVEITRQFLATNNKVINRGDSFRRREKTHSNHNVQGSNSNNHNVEIRVDTDDEAAHHNINKHDKSYRILFLGGREVGKTSIIDQFMSSDHADVYENSLEEDEEEADQNNRERLLTVDVNNVLTQLRLKEVHVDNTSKVAVETSRVVEEYDPDCFVLVYAVDDKDSFDLAKDILTYLSENRELAGKKCILVGAKSDLVRSRVVGAGDGCHLAMGHGVKFSEISAGVGCNVDTLLVGIVLQCRLDVSVSSRSTSGAAVGRGEGGAGGGLMSTIQSVFSKVMGGGNTELKKQCMNLHI